MIPFNKGIGPRKEMAWSSRLAQAIFPFAAMKYLTVPPVQPISNKFPPSLQTRRESFGR
jgi:hypothetical protein